MNLAPSRGARAWQPGAWSALWIATPVVVLATIALRFHPVGDFFTESDFYAFFAPGARALLGGHFDWARYTVHGPVYEALLAALGAVIPDLFLAARLVSVLSAAVVLACAWVLLSRRGSAVAAAWIVALLAVNPVFVRYGYSATGDMLSFALFSLAFTIALTRDGRGSLAVAGIIAGLAALARYNLVTLVPGVALSWMGWPIRAARLRRAGWFVAPALLVLGICFTLGARAGHPPGLGLVSDASLYLGDQPAAAIERQFAPGSAAEPAPALTEDPRAMAARLAARLPGGALRQVRSDAATLLGWPVAALALAGLAWVVGSRRAAPLAGLLPTFALTFLALAPIYYSDRYAMVLLLFYLAPAALALASLTERRGWARNVALAAGPAALIATLHTCIALQRLEYRSLPTETLTSGSALRADAHSGTLVMARKAHIAYAAGAGFVAFPEVSTLEELGDYCRKAHVTHLYYSWYELRLRPQFGFLLDADAPVPGLTVIQVTRDKPSVTYRIGEGFGREPSWWNDDAERAVIERRVNQLMSGSLE